MAVAAVGPRAAHGQSYLIDAGASELHVLVYRDGPLARLGHNHVIAAREITGRITRGSTLDGSTVEIRIPVGALSVDAAALRARYGEDFTSTPSETDIAGTAANMRGENLLDAAVYPTIGAAGVLRSGPDGHAVAVEITVKDNDWRGLVPIELEIADEVLVARGSLEVTHEELGLRPFRIMLGALRVAATIEIQFALTARREVRE